MSSDDEYLALMQEIADTMFDSENDGIEELYGTPCPENSERCGTSLTADAPHSSEEAGGGETEQRDLSFTDCQYDSNSRGWNSGGGKLESRCTWPLTSRQLARRSPTVFCSLLPVGHTLTPEGECSSTAILNHALRDAYPTEAVDAAPASLSNGNLRHSDDGEQLATNLLTTACSFATDDSSNLGQGPKELGSTTLDHFSFVDAKNLIDGSKLKDHYS